MMNLVKTHEIGYGVIQCKCKTIVCLQSFFFILVNIERVLYGTRANNDRRVKKKKAIKKTVYVTLKKGVILTRSNEPLKY